MKNISRRNEDGYRERSKLTFHPIILTDIVTSQGTNINLLGIAEFCGKLAL